MSRLLVRTIVWFIAADRHQETVRLDAVAGCEFLDDRIRLLE